MTELVIRRPLIVMVCHSFGVMVAFLNRWLILWTPMRCLKDRYPSICSRISAGILDNPLWLPRGVPEILLLVAHLALYLIGRLVVAVLGWISASGCCAGSVTLPEFWGDGLWL